MFHLAKRLLGEYPFIISQSKIYEQTRAVVVLWVRSQDPFPSAFLLFSDSMFTRTDEWNRILWDKYEF